MELAMLMSLIRLVGSAHTMHKYQADHDRGS